MTLPLQSTRFLVAPIVMALCLLTIGCGDVAGPQYQGEPLMTLQGSLTSSGASAPLEVALAWQTPRAVSGVGDQFSCEPSPTTRVKVEGSFPAAFRLDVYQPPPAESLIGRGAIKASARIVAVDSKNSVYGAAQTQAATGVTYFLAYFDAVVSETEAQAASYSGSRTKGYHLVFDDLQSGSRVTREAAASDQLLIQIGAAVAANQDCGIGVGHTEPVDGGSAGTPDMP